MAQRDRFQHQRGAGSEFASGDQWSHILTEAAGGNGGSRNP
jgi:hypothetical protein